MTRIIPAMPLISLSGEADDAADDRTRISADIAPTVIAGMAAAQTRIAGDDKTLLAPNPSSPPRRVEPVSPGVLINNNYRIQNLISAGGMGEVYRGQNVYTSDPVAVKIVLPDLARDPEMVALFMREARILGQLHDEAIVRYHNFVLDAGLNRYCLVMEYVDGTHLWDHVTQNGPLSEADALSLMRRIGLGLARAHALGVTHRDLSPDNVILRGGVIEEATLIDFGIARSDRLGEGGLEGRFAGKLKYIAPEQLGHWGGQVGPRTDIYGMALMIAAVLRGEPLAMGTTTAEAAQARRSIPNLGGLGARAMPLLQYMLEPDPAARPEDMRAVVAMLDDPSLVPARYRLPLWQGAGGDDVSGQGFGTKSGGVEDSSDSPFGALMSDGVLHGDAVEPSQPERRRGWLMAGAGLAALIGVSGWLTRDIWLPQTPEPAAHIATDDVPRSGQEGAPLWADSVARLPDRDTDTRAGWLAAQELQDCTMLRRVVSGPGAGQIALYAAAGEAALPTAEALLDDYQARFNARPGLVTPMISEAQCPVLDFTNALAGRPEAPPIITLDSDQLRSGSSIAGRVSDVAGRSLWLFLVTSNGSLRDLSSRLEETGGGSYGFDIGLALGPTEDQVAPQVLVAVASRVPLITAATAADGAPAAEVLARALSEIADTDGNAAADIAAFTLQPDNPQMRMDDSEVAGELILRFIPFLAQSPDKQPEDAEIDASTHQ